MLLERKEVFTRIRVYNELRTGKNTNDIDFLRQIERDLDINIHDIQVIDILGHEYFKIYYSSMAFGNITR